MDTDSRYMAKALDLAKLGLGKTAPNSLVGGIDGKLETGRWGRKRRLLTTSYVRLFKKSYV